MGNKDANHTDTTTQSIVRSLVGSLHRRLDNIDDNISEVKGDVKAFGVEVKRNSADIQNLYSGQGKNDTAIATVQSTQANCPARKIQEAGSLPGTTDDKRSNTIAIIAAIIAAVAVVVAVLV